MRYKGAEYTSKETLYPFSIELQVTYKGETRNFDLEQLLMDRGYDSVEEMVDRILEHWQ